MAEGVRRAARAWGLELCAKPPKWYSDAVTAICVPAGFDGNEVAKVAYLRYNLWRSLGLSKVAGKVFRIGHLGNLNDLMVLTALAGSEMAMRPRDRGAIRQRRGGRAGVLPADRPAGRSVPRCGGQQGARHR